MSTRRPTLLLPAILAMTLAAGCSPAFPPALAPDGSVAGEAAQQARGAIEIRVAAAARRAMALEGIVARVRFELSGANVPAGTAAIEVTRDQFTGGRATVRWKDLLPGAVTVKVQLLDGAGTVIGRAEGSTTIEAGKTANLTLAVVPETGVATFGVDISGEPMAGVGAVFSNVATGSWQAAPPMAVARAAHALVTLSGQAVAVGGDFSNLLERFDPATWRWIPQPLPADRRARFSFGSAAALRNEIVMVGRTTESGDKPEAATPIFIDPFAPPFDGITSSIDAARSESSYLTDVQAQRTAVGAASDGEFLYMLGGSSRRSMSGSLDYAFITLDLVEVLPAASGIWSVRAPLLTARGAPGAAMLGGKLYAACGFRWKGTSLIDPLFGVGGTDSQSAEMEALSAFEEYDPLADKWTARQSAPTPRYGLALVASAGRLWAIGGASSTGAPLATVESFDPAAGTWRSEPPLATPRALAAAAALPDGTILVSGGFGPARTAMRSVEAFKP